MSCVVQGRAQGHRGASFVEIYQNCNVKRGVRMGSDGFLRLVDVAEVGLDQILVHDEQQPFPSLAFALSRLNVDDESPTPFGVFRDVQRTEYSSAVADQVMEAADAQGPGDLAALLRSNGTWPVG